MEKYKIPWIFGEIGILNSSKQVVLWLNLNFFVCTCTSGEGRFLIKIGRTSIRHFTLSQVIFAPKAWSKFTLWKRASGHDRKVIIGSSLLSSWSLLSSLRKCRFSRKSPTRGFPSKSTKSEQRKTVLDP